MDEFLGWFFEFISKMLIDGVWKILSNFFNGFIQIFNFPYYISLLRSYADNFGALDWILSIISFLLVYCVWGVIIFMLILFVRKYVRFRKTIVSNEDLLEEMAEMHKNIVNLTKENEKLLSYKMTEKGITLEEINSIINPSDDVSNSLLLDEKSSSKGSSQQTDSRFARLTLVDEAYSYYIAPQYDNNMNLKELCDDFRNFACYQMHLYYDVKVIRLMFAGLASTKLILLQGISGTGKTSLPYSIGKYLKRDATIASVQPSWRDRSELFGYFNEFTKKFNETEFLKRVYSSIYNDDINIIVLDEMNIARVEYYFAEMLSVLEMPDPTEWKIELVPSSWDTDPKMLEEGKLTIPQNVWYIGTANNDDSTFAVSDKVYDRALTINLDSKGMEFDAPETESKNINYSYVEGLYQKAIAEMPVTDEILDKIGELDLYVIEKFRVAFGNRIMKQLKLFVPVYVACGGTVNQGVDYILATKVFRKFESLNLSLIRDEIKGLIAYLDELFGKGEMAESIAFLERLQRMY